MRAIGLTAVLALMLGASGSARSGESVGEAVITVENTGPRMIGVHTFKGVDNCTKRSSMALLGSRKEKLLRAKPGAQFTFSMLDAYSSGTFMASCGVAIKFTPEPGARYRAVFWINSERCGYRFIQEGDAGETGRLVEHEPLDFEIPSLPFQPACKPYPPKEPSPLSPPSPQVVVPRNDS